MSDNYLLVTAAKNEQKYLQPMIESIIAQSHRPALWILIDDGSADATGRIMEEVAARHDWIEVIHRAAGPHHGLRYAQALRQGFDYAESLSAVKGISYGYLALVDADLRLETTFFENLIVEFSKDPALGLASGGVYHNDSTGLRALEKHRTDWPRGPARMWRRDCYKQIGGQPVAISADSVANVKSRYGGWKTKVFADIKAVGRASGSTKGHWAHCRYAAESAYYLHYHPLLVIARALYFVWAAPHYGFLPFLVTYLSQWIQGAQRSKEPSVRDYYRNERLREYIQYTWARLTGSEPPFRLYLRNHD